MSGAYQVLKARGQGYLVINRLLSLKREVEVFGNSEVVARSKGFVGDAAQNSRRSGMTPSTAAGAPGNNGGAGAKTPLTLGPDRCRIPLPDSRTPSRPPQPHLGQRSEHLAGGRPADRLQRLEMLAQDGPYSLYFEAADRFCRRAGGSRGTSWSAWIFIAKNDAVGDRRPRRRRRRLIDDDDLLGRVASSRWPTSAVATSSSSASSAVGGDALAAAMDDVVER